MTEEQGALLEVLEECLTSVTDAKWKREADQVLLPPFFSAKGIPISLTEAANRSLHHTKGWHVQGQVKACRGSVLREQN